MSYTFSTIVSQLPATVPFVGPDALQRKSGRMFELRLGANESDLGISPMAEHAIAKEVKKLGWYGDPESYDLRQFLSQVHNLAPENIVVGSGIDELLGLVARAFLDQGDVVVTSLGGYPTVDYHTRGLGGVLHHVPYKEFRNDLDGLIESAHQLNAKLVYLANPDNPTGTCLSAEDIQNAVDRLPATAVLLLDEAYFEFMPEDDVPVIDVDRDRVIRFRTFSKAHGLAGLRIGYLLAANEVTEKINNIRLHFGVNRVAQAAALASLQDCDFVRHVTEEVSRGRNDYYQLADSLGIRILPSSTNFVAFVMSDSEEAHDLARRLGEKGVFVRVPGGASLDRCVRVTVGAQSERERFALILMSVLREQRLGHKEAGRFFVGGSYTA